MLTKAELISQLKIFKTDGKPVTVHTSLKAIGEIEGGADTLLSALIEVFTADNGLLVIPTHTWITCTLDLRNPESCLGVLPTIASRHPDGIRSMHPTHSVTVFGNKEKAENFIAGDAFADTPANPDGSYGNLLRENGYVLLIGVGQTKNTFLHCVEEMMNYPRYTRDKITATIIEKNGTVKKRQLFWFDDSQTGDVSLNFGKFEPAFRYHGCIRY